MSKPSVIRASFMAAARGITIAPLLLGVLSVARQSFGQDGAPDKDASAPLAAAPVDFNRDVKPILAEHCLQCHGPDKAEAGLNLADRASATARLESESRAVVPGRPEASELLRRVMAADASERMPPEKAPLKPAQIDQLRRWIAGGAEWQEHWSFRPVVKPKPPVVADSAWVRNPIDQFVLAALRTRASEPSPAADRHVLIKRLYLDLLGLLPDAAEVRQFVQDERPDAYEQLVDRLLKSPHFGERWGRHWLDMARFADSDGYEKDRARPDAYVFRDWVIDALNNDMPFDQFTIEQLAGDLLPSAGASQLVATAFNRQTLTNEEGGVDQEEYRVAAVFDRVETIGAVWLGLTVGCARCHSHKYDPLSHAEYYRMFAFFNAADEVNVQVPVNATDRDAYQRELAPLRDVLTQRKHELAPRQMEWETQQRDRLNATPATPLRALSAEVLEVRSTGSTRFEELDDGSYLARTAAADGVTADANANPVKSPDGADADSAGAGEDYSLVLKPQAGGLTGLRIDAIPDERLPEKGPGRAPNGNFVVNGLRLGVVDEAGVELRTVGLQRAAADFEQAGFKAADVLNEQATPKKGWAIGGKIGAAHQLTVRTLEPLELAPNERLRLVIRQSYGRQHALGRFRVTLLSGDARGLSLPPAIITALEMYPEKRVAATRQSLFDYYVGQDPTVQQLEREIAALNKRYNVEFRAVRTLAQSLRNRPTHRFNRGEFLQPQERVEPGTPAVLPTLPVATGNAANRLDLARWLVANDNPLTPRVAANHVWTRLFGAGLVATPNDFGARGERPTNPELLDWLAATYRDELGWSTKRLIKTIVMSATYRQDSRHRPELAERDPTNQWLGRQNRFRVEGEIVRDLALDAAGLLSPKIGGPSVFPPMPADLAKLSYANNFSWTDSKGDDRYRRGMYTFFKRTIPHPMLMTFDCPDANVACVKRTLSNTPLQALTLLNSESFHEAAQALAQRSLLEPAADDKARLADVVERCLARGATPAELERYANLLASARRYYADHPDDAKQLIGAYSKAPVPPAEAASWVATVRVVLNVDEFVTRE